MITIQEERLEDCVDSLCELAAEHFLTVRKQFDLMLEFKPDRKTYLQIASTKNLLLLCMRDNNTLVGYSAIVLQPDHANYETILSSSLLLFVAEKYRGRNSLLLIDKTEELAKANGASNHVWGVKPEYDFSKYLLRKGARLNEVSYIKHLGG